MFGRVFKGREIEELTAIAKMEGRSRADVIRLLVRIGMRVYKTKKSLLCAFRDCNRVDCCGTARPRRIADHLKLVVDKIDRVAILGLLVMDSNGDGTPDVIEIISGLVGGGTIA